MTDPTAPETPAEQTDPQPSQQARLAARRKKRILVTAGVATGIVALAALGTVGLSAAHETANPPEAKVEEYLDALIDGRASDALALSGADGDFDISDPKAALLSDEVFGAAKNRITSYEILDVTSDEDQNATVTAEIDQGGSKYTKDFEVSSINGAGLFSDRWSLDARRQADVFAYISPEIDQVRVNGIDLTLDPEKGSMGLPALPGDYEFSAPESNIWLSVPPISVTVEVVDKDLPPDIVSLVSAPTPALTDAVDKQIDAYLAACMASTSPRPDKCTNRIDERNSDITEVTWQLVTPPRYSVGVGPDGTVLVWMTKPGRASASPTGAAMDPGRDLVSSFWASGTIEINGDAVTFVPSKPF